MVWIALTLILLSFALTIKIKRQKVYVRKEVKTEHIGHLLGLSAILIGTTVMIGYIMVSYLGQLGLFLSETFKAWIS